MIKMVGGMIEVVAYAIIKGTLSVALVLLCLIALLRSYAAVHRWTRKRVVGFFHPYCDGAGGGERVLWKAIQQLLKTDPKLQIVIFSGDTDTTPADILKKAADRFNLGDSFHQDVKVKFVFVQSRGLLEAEKYPRFTMIFQSIASMFVGLEALWRYPCEIFVDTTGFAFTYPVAAWGFGCRVACYTHYPTISSDMLARVQSRRPSYNNDERITGSSYASEIKILYYVMFAGLYRLCGRFAEVRMVNSSWTQEHVEYMWALPATIVYPPCDTSTLNRMPLAAADSSRSGRPAGIPLTGESFIHGRDRLVISVGQFRPEKDHMLQLEAFAEFVKLAQTPSSHSARLCERAAGAQLVMIGGCRNEGDQQRVDALLERAKALGLQDRVQIVENASFPVLLKYLAYAVAGLHTMWNEHFGIGVVEFMAAGVITVAHNSGGPRADIVKAKAPINSQSQGAEYGYLASDAEQYASCLVKIFESEDGALEPMRARARQHALTFSDESFMEGFQTAINPLLHN